MEKPHVAAKRRREAGARRRFIVASQQLQQVVTNAAQGLIDDPSRDVLGALREFDDIRERLEADPRSLRPYSAKKSLERIRARAEGREQPVPLEWATLRSQFGRGLWPGCHIIVGSTGAGKSQLSLQLALHAARQGVPVTYVGLELDEVGVDSRLMAIADGNNLSWGEAYEGRLGDDLDRREAIFQRMANAAEEIEGLPLHLEFGDSHGWSPDDLRHAAHRLHIAYKDKPVRLIVVDYLQVMSANPGERSDPLERVARASYAARDVARRYGCAVVLLSSTSRENMLNMTKNLISAGPTLSGTGQTQIRRLESPDALVGCGKYSGDIEYSADTLTALVRLKPEATERWGKDPARGIVLATAKRRNGPAGWCGAFYDRGIMTAATESEMATWHARLLTGSNNDD
jgi:replicative DNA helicase